MHTSSKYVIRTNKPVRKLIKGWVRGVGSVECPLTGLGGTRDLGSNHPQEEKQGVLLCVLSGLLWEMRPGWSGDRTFAHLGATLEITC